MRRSRRPADRSPAPQVAGRKSVRACRRHAPGSGPPSAALTGEDARVWSAHARAAMRRRMRRERRPPRAPRSVSTPAHCSHTRARTRPHPPTASARAPLARRRSGQPLAHRLVSGGIAASILVARLMNVLADQRAQQRMSPIPIARSWRGWPSSTRSALRTSRRGSGRGEPSPTGGLRRSRSTACCPRAPRVQPGGVIRRDPRRPAIARQLAMRRRAGQLTKGAEAVSAAGTEPAVWVWAPLVGPRDASRSAGMIGCAAQVAEDSGDPRHTPHVFRATPAQIDCAPRRPFSGGWRWQRR
ncbi:MAG: hypothetical protein QOH72_4081 [Solirubrobacteraceae bacterium]|nr:hypothetical protein [Solirubrobacteraceae bacterium]